MLNHSGLLLHQNDLDMKDKMVNSGVWEKPISIEINHFLILDGQHRYEVAKILGFDYIPCELFDYNDPL